MQHTLVGVFDSQAQARTAADHLRARGFSDSVSVSDSHDSPSASSGANDGTGTGMSDGANDGFMGGIRHFFSGLFGDDSDAPVNEYAEAVRRGGAVVKVDVEDDAQLDSVRQTLEDDGAVDIEERADEWRASGWDGGVKQPARSTTATALSADAGTGGQTVLPVVKEELEVGKRVVRTGGIRVYSRSVSQPVSETVDLRSERAQVERRPVDRAVTQEDLSAMTDKTIEVRETAEKPVVSKTARVVEEVVVGKLVEHESREISDTLRNTEVRVDRIEESEARPFESLDADYRKDFDARYGVQGDSYDDYQPAYRYGHGLAGDEQHRGRSWDEIEPSARQDWETRYPGNSWERFKAAIRHGWERMTG